MTADVNDGQLIVVVSGEVDLATADVMYDNSDRPDVTSLRLDLRQVSFFDSAAIRALIRLVDRYPGGSTVIPSQYVKRVLDLCGLGDQEWIHQG